MKIFHWVGSTLLFLGLIGFLTTVSIIASEVLEPESSKIISKIGARTGEYRKSLESDELSEDMIRKLTDLHRTTLVADRVNQSAIILSFMLLGSLSISMFGEILRLRSKINSIEKRNQIFETM